MNIDFWLTRWTRKEIGFHQRTLNPYLTQYWPLLHVDRARSVFVPLCGKTLDMRWLSESQPVLGVEIARNACIDFFSEWNVAPQIQRIGEFESFSARNVTILCGDFFALRAEHLRNVGGVFDRAALIALPPEMRTRYAAHLLSIIPAGTPLLLIAPEYAQHEMSGPPFAVAEAEIRVLFEGRDIEVLEQVDISDDPDNARFRQRGVTRLVERVCKIV